MTAKVGRNSRAGHALPVGPKGSATQAVPKVGSSRSPSPAEVPLPCSRSSRTQEQR